MTTTGCAHQSASNAVVDVSNKPASVANGRIVITSPGTINMAAIAALAKALERPVVQLAKAIHQAPTVLARGLTTEQQSRLVEACCQLGIQVEAQVDDQPLQTDLARFDLAVHITDPAAIPGAVEVVSGVVGVAPEQAYQMLATPPGSIIGDISQASVSALTARFEPGVQVSVSKSGAGPFDLFVPTDIPSNAEIERLCGRKRGLVRLGLNRDAANRVFSRLPRGSVRLVARTLIRFDVVFEHGGDQPSEQAVTWLADNFGVQPEQIPTLLHHAPIALAEGLAHEQAQNYAESAQAVGLSISEAPAGFGRFAIIVTEANDMTALSAALNRAQLPVPDALPATVASDLSDFDARWKAFQLELVGASVAFEACP